MNFQKDKILNGVHVGEHSFTPDAIIREIETRCLPDGLNFVTIRTPDTEVPPQYFCRWAQYMAQKKIYFAFLYTIQKAPAGRLSHLTPELVRDLRRIAGEYFLGDMLGELGSSFTAKLRGYFKTNRDPMPPQDARDMAQAHENYKELVGRLVQIDRDLGVPHVLSVEATVLNHYNLEAGVDIPTCEYMCGRPDISCAAMRGAARAYHAPLWGTYIAQEWYGGTRHTDRLKRERLKLGYRYAYLAGSRLFCLESGDEAIASYGESYPRDSVLCEEYRLALADCQKWIREDTRPVGGPMVRVAFIQGNDDAWGDWGAGAVWSQFRAQWAKGAPEHAWRILDEIGVRRDFSDPADFGEENLSALPGYGQYDLLPANAPTDVMAQYDYLIFAGWNTMTDELYEKLKTYVQGGGILFACAAHLNTNAAREGDFRPVHDGDVCDLFGCRLGAPRDTISGLKFDRHSLIPSLLYPGSDEKEIDPLCSAGNVRYAAATLAGGRCAAYLSDSFHDDEDERPVALVENACGKGVAILLCATDYPGSAAAYPAYRTIVRELLTDSHRTCPIRVGATDRVRFSVYADGHKIYLLNTDPDFPAHAKIKTGEKEIPVDLAPCEMRAIVLE